MPEAASIAKSSKPPLEGQATAGGGGGRDRAWLSEFAGGAWLYSERVTCEGANVRLESFDVNSQAIPTLRPQLTHFGQAPAFRAPFPRWRQSRSGQVILKTRQAATSARLA